MPDPHPRCNLDHIPRRDRAKSLFCRIVTTGSSAGFSEKTGQCSGFIALVSGCGQSADYQGRCLPTISIKTDAVPDSVELRPSANKQVMIQISVIIPVLDEAAQIESRLTALQSLRRQGHELILVDGGSSDHSPELARRYVDHLLVSDRGRARQMNAGAAAASGDWLLFLHLDTQLPDLTAARVASQLAASGHDWGWFDVRLSNPRWPFRIIAWHMNRRARLTRVCTGDQALFIRREVFVEIGGFPELPLMEDVAMSKLLRRRSAPLVQPGPVITSARRWEQYGVLRTVLLMWRLRLLYWLGVSPARLASLYYRPGGNKAKRPGPAPGS